MLPGLGGLNPKKMQAMMKQLGIKQEEVEATRVIIERGEGNIVIKNPQVSKINMHGQDTWQIIGEASEEEREDVREGDVKLIMEKTGKNKEEAENALDESNGDIVQAILKLGE